MTKHAGKPTFRRMRAKKKIPPPHFILSVFWIKGRYVFSWGGRDGEFWYFFRKKVLALPHVLIKKFLAPPPHF